MSEVKQPAVKKAKQIYVETVYGPMHHLLKDFKIEGTTPVDEIDTWLQAQIDAGKLKLVD